MKSRCYSKNNKSYKHYGQLGIIVCNEWKNNYENFRYWALENGYSDNLTIDRINVFGNYTPYNCRWATYAEQNNNKKDNWVVGNTGMTLKQYCDKENIIYNTVLGRLLRNENHFDLIQHEIYKKYNESEGNE